VSIVFFTETWRPQSFYDKIALNKKQGLHTLCLLDIKVKEPTLESLARGRPVYEPPRYMTINTCIEQLLEIEADRQEGVTTAESMCVGVARMGAMGPKQEERQLMVAGTLEELRHVAFGRPLHSFVVCGELDDFGEQMLQLIRVERLSAEGTLPAA
jgi:diphthine methyl ester synthase